MSRLRSKKPIRFALVSPPRSGSWLLWTSLAQHPKAALFGEVFSDEIRGKPATDRLWRSPFTLPWRPILRGEAGDSYLHDEIFGRLKGSVFDAVGVKLLYQQGRRTRPMARAWDYLAGHSDIKIVHLRRDNLLERYVSLKAALETDRWYATSDEMIERGKPGPMRLSPQECAANFRGMRRQQVKLDALFAGHEVLDLEYDKDLVTARDDTLARIQCFVGLATQPTFPALRKQATAAIQDKIANYDELRRAFEGSPFAAFFRPASRPAAGRWT